MYKHPLSSGPPPALLLGKEERASGLPVELNADPPPPPHGCVWGGGREERGGFFLLLRSLPQKKKNPGTTVGARARRFLSKAPPPPPPCQPLPSSPIPHSDQDGALCFFLFGSRGSELAQRSLLRLQPPCSCVSQMMPSNGGGHRGEGGGGEPNPPPSAPACREGGGGRTQPPLHPSAAGRPDRDQRDNGPHRRRATATKKWGEREGAGGWARGSRLREGARPPPRPTSQQPRPWPHPPRNPPTHTDARPGGRTPGGAPPAHKPTRPLEGSDPLLL